MSYRPVADLWILARPKVKYHGAYPSGFLGRARSLLGVGHEDGVLHVCGGLVKDYPFDGFGPNDKTIDLDPGVKPDFNFDVRKLGAAPGDVFPGMVDGVPTATTVSATASPAQLWSAVLIDRPYTNEDAQNYAAVVHDKLPNINDLLKRALTVVKPGGKVGVLDYFVPRPPRTGVRFVALVGVVVGFGNRVRAFSIFEREVAKTEAQKQRVRDAIRGKSVVVSN